MPHRPRPSDKPPKHGPFADCTRTDDGWVLTLNADGQALVEAYMKRHKKPIYMLMYYAPKLWTVMVAEGVVYDEGSEEASEARLAVVMAAFNYEVQPESSFDSFVKYMIHIRVIGARRRERHRRHRRLPPGMEGWHDDATTTAAVRAADASIEAAPFLAGLSAEDQETLGASFGLFDRMIETNLEWAVARGTSQMHLYRRRKVLLERLWREGCFRRLQKTITVASDE